MKQIKSYFRILILLTLIFPLYRFCHKQTDGFTPRKVRTAFKDQSIEHLSSSPSYSEIREITKILSQPLHYIGRGGQCYAFATSDQQYVVKLLKYNNNYPRIWFRLFPFPFGLETYRLDKIAKKLKKLQNEYKSYEIALKNLKEETGILYVHLDGGTLPDIELQLFDKINIKHSFPADNFQFYIQKKGVPFYPELEKMAAEKNHDKARKSLDDLACYLIKRCEKHIIDKDDGIWRNFAFFEGHPFQIDIGQFCYDHSVVSQKNYQKNLLAFTQDFRNWLKGLNPTLEEHFLQAINSPQKPCDD
jgi:hypothetical protein